MLGVRGARPLLVSGGYVWEAKSSVVITHLLQRLELSRIKTNTVKRYPSPPKYVPMLPLFTVILVTP